MLNLEQFEQLLALKEKARAELANTNDSNLSDEEDHLEYEIKFLHFLIDLWNEAEQL